MSVDAIAAAAAVVSAIATGLGVLLVVLQLSRGHEQERVHHRRQQRENTIENYLALLDRRSTLRRPLPDDRDEQAVAELVDHLVAHADEEDDESEETRRAVAEYLNLWEAIAVGVNHGVFDLRTIEALAGGVIKAVWKNYRRWIETRRQKYTPLLYAELEKLAKHLEDMH